MLLFSSSTSRQTYHLLLLNTYRCSGGGGETFLPLVGLRRRGRWRLHKGAFKLANASLVFQNLVLGLIMVLMREGRGREEGWGKGVKGRRVNKMSMDKWDDGWWGEEKAGWEKQEGRKEEERERKGDNREEEQGKMEDR